MIRLAFCLGIFVGMITGCAQPEGIDITKLQDCVVTPGDVYRYWCEDGTYRCANADGTTKYKDCQLNDVYCVEVCK